MMKKESRSISTIENERLKKSDAEIGTWIQSGSPAVVEVLDECGAFHFLCIDQEHTPVSWDTEAHMIRAARHTPIYVRMAAPDFYETKRHLDLGAKGVIAPMVETFEQAEAVVDGARYPLQGRRGLGYCRANQYGESLPQTYNGQVIFQIETARGMDLLAEWAKAVQNSLTTDEIYLWPRPDAILIGPYDLAQSMAIDVADVRPFVLEILGLCNLLEVPCGVHVVSPIRQELDEYIKAGCRFMAYGTDLEFMKKGAL